MSVIGFSHCWTHRHS